MSEAFSLDTGITTHASIRVIVPEELPILMRSILAAMQHQGDEVGIFLKGELDKENMTFTVKCDEYILPKQTVTGATIRFEEDAPRDYNVVVHRHPHGCRQFSGTDAGSINKEFECSILFMAPDEFPMAVVNLEITRTTQLQVPAHVQVASRLYKRDDQFVARVRENVRHGGQRLQLPAPGEKGPGGIQLRKRVSPEDHQRQLDLILGREDDELLDQDEIDALEDEFLEREDNLGA